MSAAVSAIQAHPWMQRVLAAIGSRTVRITLTIALVAFGLSQIPLQDVLQRLENANVALAAGGAVLLLLGQVLSGQRWRRMAAHLGLHETSGWFVSAYLRGCFYNSVLPTGIGGDAVRVALIRPVGTWRTATRSVILDRVTGLAALALAAGLFLPIAGLGLPPELTWPAAAIAAAGFAAALLVSIRQALVGWLGWTIAFEAVWFGGVWLLARSLSVHLSWATPAVVLVVGIAMALPISFGGHGAREAGFVLALAPLGVEADQAVALGVLFGCALALVGLAGAFVRVKPARLPVPASGPQVPAIDRSPAPARSAATVGSRA